MATFELKIGETRDVTIPSHTLTSSGYSTFTINNVDDNKPIQWSIIGARKSELVTNSGKQYAHACRVWVLEDQYTEEEQRVVHISAICTETGSNKQQSEARSTLIIKKQAQQASADFTYSTAAPPSVTLQGSTTTPANVMISARFGDPITDAASQDLYHAVLHLDIDGKAGLKGNMTPNSTSPFNVFHMEVTDYIKSAEDIIAARGYANVSYTVDMMKATDDTWENVYQHQSGGRFTVQHKAVSLTNNRWEGRSRWTGDESWEESAIVGDDRTKWTGRLEWDGLEDWEEYN